MLRPAASRLRRAALVAGVWLVPGLLSVSQAFVLQRVEGQPTPWRAVLPGTLAPWLLWALATPLIAWIVRRYSFDAGLRRAVRAHLAFGVPLVLAMMTAYVGMLYALDATLTRPFGQMWVLYAGARFALQLLVYAAVVGALEARAAQRRAQEETQRAAALTTTTAALQAQLAQAHLAALRMQLHPHFLFNTLNAVAGLVRTGRSDAAVQTLARLSDLLRLTLDRTPAQTVALADELDLLTRYLDVERIRFGDRLRVVHDVAPDALRAAVPSLLLQPLVENALRHGLGPRAAPGTLTIRAQREEDRLVLTVADDGAGMPAAVTEGVGVGNVRERLHRLYGDAAAFTLRPRSGGGTEAVAALPFTPAASSTAP